VLYTPHACSRAIQVKERASTTDPAKRCDKFLVGKARCPADCAYFPRCSLRQDFLVRSPGMSSRSYPFHGPLVAFHVKHQDPLTLRVMTYGTITGAPPMAPAYPRSMSSSFMRQHRYPGPTEAFAKSSRLAKLGRLRVECMGADSGNAFRSN
jgi:hypothetical protein